MGQLPASQNLKLVITLPLRNEDQLDQLLTDLYDPSSPNYRHFLTVEQFTEQFGPTQAEYDAVLNFAKENGLAVTGTSRNRLIVQVSGSAANVESAFHVKMDVYQHPTENRTFFAPDREPTHRPYVFSVARLRTRQLLAPASCGPRQRPAGSEQSRRHHRLRPVCFVPGQRHARGLLRRIADRQRAVGWLAGVLRHGSGRREHLLHECTPDQLCSHHTSFYGRDEHELRVFRLRRHRADSRHHAGAGHGAGIVEPGRCTSGSTDSAIFNAMATASPLNAQLSSSWTWYPADPGTDDPYFKEFAAQGQNLFQAAGDSKKWTTTGTASEIYPADDVYVTSVGGTDLSTAAAGGAWSSETAWVDSGGGISPHKYAIPSWQTAAAAGCASCSQSYRNGPDVSANANFTFYVCADQTTCTANSYGGTSFAAPMWAGYLALVNQQSARQRQQDCWASSTRASTRLARDRATPQTSTTSPAAATATRPRPATIW